MKSKIFRKVSIERLSSPEQLDTLMKVTSPRGWVALLALGLLLAAAVFWGIYGSLSTKINGQGVLIKSGGVQTIYTTTNGQVTDVSVAADDVVHRGDVIARISQPAVLEEMTELNRELEQLKSGPQEDPAVRKQAETLESRLNILRNEYDRLSRIVSPYEGRVLEVKVERGDLISAGTPVISLEFIGANVKDLITVMYIPATEGKKVLPGMDVQISPTSVNKEEYGFMLGRVTNVSEFPATTQGMLRTLGNEALVRQLSGNAAMLEVQIDLIPDDSTVSGYKWSSPEGPPVKVNSGTFVVGSITIKTERPIRSVIPIQ